MTEEPNMSPELWLFLAALTMAAHPSFDPLEEHADNLRELLQRTSPIANA